MFGDAVILMADASGIELDEVRCEAGFAQTTEDLDLGSWSIPAGCVAGVEASWQGWVGDRTVVELKVRWRKGRTLDPDWPIEDGYVVDIQGQPCVKTKLEMYPRGRLRRQVLRRLHGARHDHDVAARGRRHPRGVAAAPGIVTYLDLPLVTAKGFVPER